MNKKKKKASVAIFCTGMSGIRDNHETRSSQKNNENGYPGSARMSNVHSTAKSAMTIAAIEKKIISDEIGPAIANRVSSEKRATCIWYDR